MVEFSVSHISSFCLVGINYKKTDAAIRGKYSVSTQQYAEMLAAAKENGIEGMMVLSTCNRTEVYGFAQNSNKLAELLCSHTSGNKEEFLELAYLQSSTEAVEHMLQVATGLDSQILGDYEIVGQMRQSAKFARKNGHLDPTMDRIINTVMNTAKKVRTKTRLSHGTISVSFAAVQCIKKYFPGQHNLKVLLVGLGKIGSNTFKNLVDYLPNADITVINRNVEKAQLQVGNRFTVKNWDCLTNEISKANVIVVATSAATPVINIENIGSVDEFKLFIDLSIPFNIAPEVGHLPMAKLVNVDELSVLNDNTLAIRKAEIPKAKATIK